MSVLVMSDKYQEFVDSLKCLGHTIICTDVIDNLLFPEQKHADMQILKLNDTFFILKECQNLKFRIKEYNLIECAKNVGKTYPENILLNYLFINNKLFGKINSMDYVLKNFCYKNQIKTVNVNQGYSRCSTLAISDNAVITADESINKTLSENGVEVLKISAGSIKLDGFDYGFIGGASGVIDDTVVFFGNVTKHPDYIMIKEFCSKHNKIIKIISPELPLTDIGGIVKIR